MNKQLMALALAVLSFAQAVSAQADAKRAVRDASYLAFLETLKATPTRVVDYDGLLAAAKGLKVVVLGGYSGLGYEHPPALRERLKSLMKAQGSGVMYVSGATADGIGAAYKWIPELAAELKLTDIRTAGIVSRNAWEWGIEPQDYVVFVDTPVEDWNVVVDETTQPSQKNVAKKVTANPTYVVDGTVKLVEDAATYPTLKVIRDDVF